MGETVIYTRMGTRVTPLSKPDKMGFLRAEFHFADGPSVREVHLSDLRADGGAKEIDAALAALPAFEEARRG